MLAGVKTDCKLVDAELDRRLSGGAPASAAGAETPGRMRALPDAL